MGGACSEREGRLVLGQHGVGVGAVGEEFDDALGSPRDGCFEHVAVHHTAVASALCQTSNWARSAKPSFVTMCNSLPNLPNVSTMVPVLVAFASAPAERMNYTIGVW